MSNRPKVKLPELTPEEVELLLTGLLNVARALKNRGHDNAVRWLVMVALLPLQRQQTGWLRATRRRKA